MQKVKNVITRSGLMSSVGGFRSFSSSKTLIEPIINDKTGIATVTMKNPPVNAMTLDFFNDFISVLDDLGKNKTRGMIVTSGLNNVFCAGLNINELYKPDEGRFMHYYWKFQEFFLKLYSSSYVTVAAINGHAPAGGCMLSLSTEYRIMKDNYKIGLNEVALGVIAPAWLMDVMASVISTRNAELALNLGTLFTTKEALQIGLIDETASSDIELMTKAENFLIKSLKINPTARGQTKNIFREKIIKEFLDKREYDRKQFVSNAMKPAIQQQIGAYLESLKNKSKN